MKTIVYVVNNYDFEFDDSPRNWDDKKFISEATIQGRVYSLEQFQEAFNDEEINSSTEFIRVITE